MTSPRSLTPERLRQLSGEDLVNFVSGRGWTRVKNRRPTVAVLSKSEPNGAEIAVPIDPTYGDYADRLLDALRVVAVVEHIELTELAIAITLTGTDILKWRRDDGTPSGTIWMEDGLAFFEGARKAFLASAHTAIDPERFYRQLRRQEAEEYVQQCRIGPTHEGSFVATFFCPVAVTSEKAKHKKNADQAELEPFARVEFGRLVTSSVVKQMARLATAATLHDGELLGTSKSDRFMVSGNFCDAVLQMSTSSLRELTVSVSWSSPPMGEMPSVATLTADQLPAVEEFARELRPAEENKPERFLGKIGLLKANPDRDMRAEGGEVTLHAIARDGAVRARLHLDEADYQRAVHAHDVGANVSVTGVLERRPGVTAIKNPAKFAVMEDERSPSLFDK